ncbi:hypothetical protein SMG44B_60110 [Stenotrophomonas maltophilia]
MARSWRGRGVHDGAGLRMGMLQRGRRRLRRGSANGGAPPWWRYSVILGLGRVGRRVGGRRKPILGGLAAASMPRTPPPRLPTRPLTVSCGVHHGKSQTRAKAGRFARKAEPASQPPLLLPLLLPFLLIFPWCVPEAGNCPRPGGEAGQGREPHGCGDRAYMDVLAAPPALPPHPAKPINRAFRDQPNPTTEGLRRSPTLAEDALFRARKKFPTDVSIPSPLVRCTQ